jgi:transcriptional regulator with XRE-family HTH domain
MRYKLPDVLRDARKQKGLSQEALAKASGAARITIARLEAGSAQDFRLGTLTRLCEALGLELVALPKGRRTGHEKALDARRRHAALAAALLAVPGEQATAMVTQAKAELERWERERLHSAAHIKLWRARLEGPVRTVALRLLEHSDQTAALLADSPWAFALEPEVA